MHDARQSRKPAAGFGPPLVLVPGTPDTVAANIAARVAKRPDGVIRSFGPGGAGRSQSYADTWYRSGSMLAGMREAGIGPGKIIVLLIEDAIDFVPAYWACIRGGFVAAPLMSAARERSHQRSDNSLREALNRLNDVTVVTDESFAAIATTVGQEEGLRVLPLRVTEGRAGYDDHDASPANPLCLVPSSGSTGRLKLVALSHSNVLYRSFADPFIEQGSYLATVALDSISAAQNGIFLSYGSWIQMSPAAVTARPTSVLDAIERHHITVAGCLPSAAKMIVAAAERTGRKWDLGSLSRFALGAEPVVPRIMQILGDFLDRSGSSRKIITAGYGTTETGFLVTGAYPFARLGRDDDAVSLGTCAPGVELRIVGDDDEVLAEGDIGEVQVNSPRRIFSCYWGEPEATRKSFTDDGWWRTGDLGRLQNGELSLHGRAKDVLVVSGRKFSLVQIDAEIETVLAVGDRAFSCAIHWSGETTERLAVVFVAADASAERRSQLADSIRSLVARRFGLRPSPVIGVALDDIPLAANGKLRRLALAARVRSGTLGAVEEPEYTRKEIPGSSPNEPADIERTLEQIWREVLDISGDLDRHADFFELGGDSLRSLTLYMAIETHFGRQISAEAFFKLPTFASLLGLIANGHGEPASVENAPDGGSPLNASVPWPLPIAIRNRLLAPLETWPGERPTRGRTISGMNTDGDRPPLFWVFNDQREFRELACALGPAQPLYGLRSGVGIIDYQEDEIQTFALRYISEITEVAPQGPFFVGGNCQGAIIALAIAQHALRRQRHVPLLILMDWAFDLQSYGGRVLLVSGRDNAQYNAYRRFARPELAWRRAFANFDFVEIPGGYAQGFDKAAVVELSGALATHMRSALAAPTVLMPARAYRASIFADALPVQMKSQQRCKIRVTVKNDSDLIWRQTTESGLMVGSRWTDPDGDLIHQIDERATLPEIKPNAYATVDLKIIAPNEPGDLNLHIDLSEEGNRWFNRNPKSAFSAAVSIVGRQPHFLNRIYKRVFKNSDVLPIQLLFSSGAPAVTKLIFGWSVPEKWGTWSDGPRAKLLVPVSDRYGRWCAILTCKAFGAGDRTVSIYVRSGFEGREIKWELPANIIVKKEIELECRGNDITLQFSLPDAISPQRLLLSGDRRQLSLGLIAMEIVPNTRHPIESEPIQNK